ncbi:M48 family metalloprotease [Streptomyces sp. NPDC097619]|uniref:M48 family metalloprotease n=1 Tax=Streptomyces sp. NPDC097619 TaxID=3157228 RepID=UPI00331EF4D7
MSGVVSRPVVDDRVLVAGTGARFAVLTALMLVSTGALALMILWARRATDGVDCLLAAGADPDRAGTAEAILRLAAQSIPVWACMDRLVPVPPWWQVALAPALLVIAAALLFRILPAWTVRRRRLVDLRSVDPDGDVLRLVRATAEAAGLSAVPRIVVDRAAPTAGAVVLGSTRRPIVCLHAGLLACRNTAPDHFRTVLLHEFAHISHRDVTVTYATVALWRAFGTLVLLPSLLWALHRADAFDPSARPAPSPYEIRTLLLPLVLAALVYLARADVLRTREVHADLAAARGGADIHRAVASEPPSPGGLRGAARSLTSLWSTHPSARVRRSALSDPAPVFGLRALPALLTGASAVLIHGHVLGAPVAYRRLSPWISQVTALPSAVLVCGVIGTALWRSVTHAAVTGRRAPTGVRTGLWLGAGLGAGSFVAGLGAGTRQWWIGGLIGFPLIVASGVVFTVWLTLCARLWTGAWRGGSLKPVFLQYMAAALVVAMVWFAWLTPRGLYGAFWQLVTPGADRMVREAFPGITTTGRTGVSAVVAVTPTLLSSMLWPLFTAAVAVTWIVPALALALGPFGGGVPRWVVRARLDDTARPLAPEPPPALRTALAPGLLGGVLGWAAVAGALAHLHAERAGQQADGGGGGLRLGVWLFLASAGAVAVAALVAGTRARQPLVPLVAAQIAAVVGLAGTALLLSFDGCLAPLSVRQGPCRPRPVWRLHSLDEVTAFGNAVLMAAFLLAAVAVLLRWTVGWARRGRRAREPRRRGVVRPSSHRPSTRWSAVALPVVLGLALAVGEPLALFSRHAALPDQAAAQRGFQRLLGDPPPASEGTRARQVRAWSDRGGRYLLNRAVRATAQLRGIDVPPGGDPAAQAAALARVRALCVDIGTTAAWEDGQYFRVPDPSAQSAWHAFGTGARGGASGCLTAVDRRPFDAGAFLALAAARYELDVAGSYAAGAEDAVNAILVKEPDAPF